MKFIFMIFYCLLVYIVIDISQWDLPIVSFILVLNAQFMISQIYKPKQSFILGLIGITLLFIIGYSKGDIFLDYYSITCLLFELSLVICINGFFFYRNEIIQVKSQLVEENRSLENLSAANRSFVENIEKIKEESVLDERNRITRNLHDSIGYSLTNIIAMMKSIPYLKNVNHKKIDEYALASLKLAEETLNDTRKTLYEFRKMNERKTDVVQFFMNLCNDFSEAVGIKVTCEPGNLMSNLDEEVFNLLFRTIQVGFINALRHAKAVEIHVYFWVSSEFLMLKIWNSNDKSDQNMPLVEGIGLKGIRERLNALDGSLLLTRLEEGFEMYIEIPIQVIDYAN
jgi:signal transduction histidine kinase